VRRRTFLLAVAGLWGCSSAPARAKIVQVTIDQLVFAPAEIVVRVGDTIEWVNKDVVDHTATTQSKEWDVVIPAGKTVPLVVKTPGGVAYYCRYHPTMTGRVVVEPRYRA